MITRARRSRSAADEDLERRVRIVLVSRFHPSLRRLQVAAESGTVRLSGQVASFYEKQLAIHTCQHIAGVQRLVDEVCVPETGSKAG